MYNLSYPASSRVFSSLAGRQRALVKQLDRIDRGAARDHKADARDLVSKIEVCSSGLELTLYDDC